MTPEQIAELRQKNYNATVVWIHKSHTDLMRLHVKPDKPLRVHQPGQYTSLGLGYWEPRIEGCQLETLKPGEESKVVRRAYSIGCAMLDEKGAGLAADAATAGWLEFYIVLVRDKEGPEAPALTPRLFLLKEGDRLNMVEKITGHFTAEPVEDGDAVLFLSTGTGEAPHNYMLWELLRRGHKGRILAACCVRYKRDLAYLAIHEELMRRNKNYTFLSLTTREADTVKHKVYIQDLITSGQLADILGQPVKPEKMHVYLCGNPKMIGVPSKDKETGARTYPKPLGVIEILENMGFKADNPTIKFTGNIHFEEYW
jgi:ferredoxin--NADP+ reductase